MITRSKAHRQPVFSRSPTEDHTVATRTSALSCQSGSHKVRTLSPKYCLAPKPGWGPKPASGPPLEKDAEPPITESHPMIRKGRKMQGRHSRAHSAVTATRPLVFI